ncbi:hypothetical protein NDN13_05275 [Acinetobacter sp. C32I]|uniref:hypothetical protein n=1 Tax=Acinetobacter sp. C32I TaxID=2950074 RepID=UPI002036898C|nr:hypothetical protein [Acinetobacter sp. C32I]USA54605.1 hypothetical protein NDN13_05275 [Acinetobacter sp. C32I]
MNKFLTGAGCLFLSSLTVAATQVITIPDDGKVMQLSGVVSSKPITKPDGSFKAYYLRLNSELTFNDDSNCGEQTQKTIALNSTEMKKYAGKKVTVSGNVFCQTQYTGNYHIEDIKVVSK